MGPGFGYSLFAPSNILFPNILLKTDNFQTEADFFSKAVNLYSSIQWVKCSHVYLQGAIPAGGILLFGNMTAQDTDNILVNVDYIEAKIAGCEINNVSAPWVIF